MENSKNVDVSAETEISSSRSYPYAEQSNVAENQQQEHILDNTAMASKIVRYDLILPDNANNVDTYLHSKESEDEFLQICEDRNAETNTIVEDDKIHREDEVGVTIGRIIIDKTRKRISARRNKKNNQLLVDNKKENLKKVSNCKTVRQKTTRKSNKVSLVPASMDKIYKQVDKELKENCTNLGLCKFHTEGYLKNTLLPAAMHVKSNDSNSIFNTNISCHEVAKQEELNQFTLNDNKSALQHLDYNNMKYGNQGIIPISSNPWLMAPKSCQNIALNNDIANMQTEVDYINNRQYITPDYNWKQNENPYFSSSINFMDPYNLFASENKAYCNIHGTNCTWSNAHANFRGLPNIASNYATPNVTSSNSLSSTSGLFKPFHYQPLQTDCNIKKYTNLGIINYANNSGCEMRSMIKENVIPPLSTWHHMNPITSLSNNNLNIPFNTPVTSWPETLPSYPFYTDSNINANTNTNVQINNQYGRDLMKTNLPKYQYVPGIDTYIDSYKDDGLTNTLSHQNSTATSTNSNVISDITNLVSETNSAEACKGFIPYNKTKDSSASDYCL